MKHQIVFAGFLALAACGEDANTTPEPTPAPEPTIETSAPEAEPEMANTVTSGTVVIDLVPTLEAFTVPEGLDVTVSEDGHVAISGTDEAKASNGMTSGAYLTISEAQEAIASGNTILIEITGKAETGDAASVDVAYSTAEVGNSGWSTLSFGSEVSTQSFTYDVPEMVEGRRDFLGFSPADGIVHVANVRIAVE